MLRLTAISTCVLGVLVFAVHAHAAECTGHDYYVVEMADTLDLGEGHSVTLFKSNSIGVADDPMAPDHLAGGPCSGFIEVTSDGGLKMDGYCHRTNTDGDMIVDHWWQNLGDERGTWEWVRGTGALAKLVGQGGWFESALENGALGVTRWASNCP